MNQTWTVVKFVSENSVEAVPTAWLLGENKCYWPPFPQDKIQSYIRKCEEHNTCWPLFDIEVFRNSTYESYSVARIKCKRAEELSDLNSDADNKTFKRVRKQRIYSSSEDEGVRLSIKTPPPLKRKKVVDNSTKEISQYASITRASDVIEHAPSTQSTEKTCSQILAPLSTGLEVNSRHSNLESGNCTCCPVHNNGNKYMKEILLQLHLVRSLLGDILDKVNNKNEPVMESSFLKNYNLPVDSLDQFEELENFLSNSENMNAAVIDLKKCGGNNPYNFVKRVMNILITNEIASMFSWLGRKGKKKFCETALAKVIISAGEPYSNNKSELEVAIQSWLRRAKERSIRK